MCGGCPNLLTHYSNDSPPCDPPSTSVKPTPIFALPTPEGLGRIS